MKKILAIITLPHGFMYQKIKNILAISGVVAVGAVGAVNFTPDQEETIQTIEEAIEAEQLTALVDTGKFKQISDTTSGEFQYHVDEYKGPKGLGYIEFIEYTKNDKTYQKKTVHGPEKGEIGEWDWKLINDNSPSTTPK